MKISAKAEYACLAVIELAKAVADGAPKRVRDIAEAQQIPERYLVQILLLLKAAGLVHSARGSVGGYQLARDASTLTVADIISAIDGPGDRIGRGDSAAGRELVSLLERARDAERAVLASVPIAQLAEQGSPHDWIV
jgi:Rrf2 family protein